MPALSNPAYGVIADNRRGNWFMLPGGRRFYPEDPMPGDVLIEDVAMSLAGENRWTNFTRRRISVAYHSLLVTRFVSERFKLEALLHDAHEAYCKDLSRPFKHVAAMFGYRHVVGLVDSVIRRRFGLLSEIPAEVVIADNLVLRWEARELFGIDTCQAAGWDFPTDDLPDEPIRIMTSDWAETAFLKAFKHHGGRYDAI